MANKAIELLSKYQDTLSNEDKKTLAVLKFIDDGVHTFSYVRQRMGDKSWMIEQFEGDDLKHIMSRYSDKMSEMRNKLIRIKPTTVFYINVLQNILAKYWFEKKYNVDLGTSNKDFTLRCLSPFKLNRMEHKWIVVGHKEEFFTDVTLNKNGVSLTDKNLLFVSYENKEFNFFGAVFKNDYAKYATLGKVEFKHDNLVYFPTEHFYDQDFKENPVLKDIKFGITIKKKGPSKNTRKVRFSRTADKMNSKIVTEIKNRLKHK